MTRIVRLAADRLLAGLLPTSTASASCLPQSYCEPCPNSGGRKRRVTIMADCSVTYGTCLLSC
ncbi:hypothetical protein [Dactylosporangium sp. NPDC050588]|uniref:hypothetical protein n=1 Tax=Dactylosporangium sp. NPDC050588 TaxID=3157211 RepID=UPI0033F005D7